jgi:hypothetical protein
VMARQLAPTLARAKKLGSRSFDTVDLCGRQLPGHELLALSLIVSRGPSLVVDVLPPRRGGCMGAGR